jgi:hypothetical protein
MRKAKSNGEILKIQYKKSNNVVNMLLENKYTGDVRKAHNERLEKEAAHRDLEEEFSRENIFADIGDIIILL